MKLTLRDLAEKLGSHLLGDSSITVTSVSSLQSATSDSVVFVEDARYLDAALRSSAAVVIVGEFAAGDFAASANKPILISPQPRLAFARAARLLRDPDRHRGIHPSAIVPASAEIGKNVAIGPRAVIGERVKVGDETTIGSIAASTRTSPSTQAQLSVTVSSCKLELSSAAKASATSAIPKPDATNNPPKSDTSPSKTM
jgi:UDP-3-O-[3-hydroxymyristoyl] glucosamine N-acyltransferase